MQCPKCGRGTWWPVRSGNDRVKPPGTPPDALQASLIDGTCYSCRWERRTGHRRIERGYVYRHRLTEEEIQQANHAYQRYAARRRTRGVPRDGLPVASLVRPGLFLMEVN